jgi:6-phosphogluconolactonase (cycloisomerase 2 family)
MTNVAKNRMRSGLSLLVVFTGWLTLAVSYEQAQTPPSTAKPASTGPASESSRVGLYAAVGDELSLYDVDVANATLVKHSSVMLPGNVQEAWPHPSMQYLYVAWSNGGPSYATLSSDPVSKGDRHGVSAFRIDPASGVLQTLGQPAPLPSRPIHVTVDITGRHVLTAHNDPSGVTVHRINSDGTIGALVQEPAELDVGVYAHQIRVDSSNKTVILVTRGNGPTAAKPEDPGALRIFDYNDGVLANRASIAPGGGFNFQSRHLDFHPTQPWVFLTLERQNKIEVYRKLSDGTPSPEPSFIKDTLADPEHIRPMQAAGTIHIHPTGKFVYVANRASSTVDFKGQQVFAGGENNIAVFSINQTTGEPTLIQNIDTRGMSARTFALDPSGRILVAANQVPMMVRAGANLRTVPASLAVFRVRGDGKLDFVRKYDVQAGGGKTLFWAGIVPLT